MRGGSRHKGIFAKVEMICPMCKSPFLVFPTTAKRRVHCSKKCYAEYQKTLVGKLSVRYGAKLSDETKKRMSEISKKTNKRGDEHYSWKGGKRMEGGYVMLYVPALSAEDQKFFAHLKSKDNYGNYILNSLRQGEVT